MNPGRRPEPPPAVPQVRRAGRLPDDAYRWSDTELNAWLRAGEVILNAMRRSSPEGGQ